MVGGAVFSGAGSKGTRWVRRSFGHRWFVSTRKEQLSGAEIKQRYDEMLKKDK